MAMVKADDTGARLAVEGIQRTEANMTAVAAEAGIRGVGMINQIQQNTQGALSAEGAKLSAKQSAIDVAAAQEQSSIVGALDDRNRLAEMRTDQMLERGQALRGQGEAEIGAGAAVMGKAMDQGFKDVMSAKKGGGVSGEGGGGNELSTGGTGGGSNVGGNAGAISGAAGGSGGGGGGFGGSSMGGGSFGGFCDERLKENIKRIGVLDNGAGIYSYNYIGCDFTCIGPMAQELQEVNPEAVYEIDGYLAVHFNKI